MRTLRLQPELRKSGFRVAVPLPAEHQVKRSLIPDDVWRSYHQELERAARAEQAAEEFLDDEEVSVVPHHSKRSFIAHEPADLEVALVALSQTPLFAAVDRQKLKRLAQTARQGELSSGEHLFREGDYADSFFLVLEGAIEILRKRDDREVSLRQIQQRDPIGLLGLFSGQRRAATGRAVGSTIVLEIDCQAVNDLAREDAELQERLLAFFQERLLEGFLGSSPLFADLEPSARGRVMVRFLERRLTPGEALLQLGEVSNLVAVVIAGHLMVETRQKPSDPVKQYKVSPGEYLGVISATTGTPLRTRIYSSKESTVVVLNHTGLAELTRDYPDLKNLPKRIATLGRALDRDVFCGLTGVRL